MHLTQINADQTLANHSQQDYIDSLKSQVDLKSKDYALLASDMAQTREKLSDSETCHILAKDQLRLVEEALVEIRASKQEDEQRWL